MGKFVDELARLMLKEHDKLSSKQDSQQAKLMFIYRYKKFAVQITNGHLETNKENKMMPMFPVYNCQDEDFVKSLQAYNFEEGKTSAKNNRQETISSLSNSENVQKRNIVEGLPSQIRSLLFGEETLASVGETLGFNVIFKGNSSGRLDTGGKDRCLAARTCVHCEEIKREELVESVVKTFDNMKRLRNNPSCIMGIQEHIEVHLDAKRISITCGSGEKEKTFISFLSKVLKLIGIDDLNSAKVRYRKEVTVEDPLWLKALGMAGCIIADILGFFSRDKMKAIYVSLVLMVGIPVSALVAVQLNHSVFRTAILMLPAVLVLAEMIRISSEENWLLRIGQEANLAVPFMVFVLSGLIYMYVGFTFYFTFILLIAVLIVIYNVLDDNRVRRIKGSNIWKEASSWKVVLSKKLLSNSFANITLAAMTILVAITGFAAFGVLIFLAAFPVGSFVLGRVMADGAFWNEMREETERYKDRSFSLIREDRPELSKDCEIRLRRCWKLALWIPIKVFFTQIREFGENKYPDYLKFSNIFEKVSELVKKQYAKISS